MASDVTLRRYLETDDPGIAIVMKEVSRSEQEAPYYQWKYQKNPTGRALSVVAEREGVVVGQSGAIPIRLHMNGKEVLSSQEVDGCLTEAERRFDRLFQMLIMRRKVNAEERVWFSFFFSVGVSSKLALKMDAYKVCPQPGMVKPLDVEPYLSKRLPPQVKGLSRLLAPPANILLRLLDLAAGPAPRGTRIREVERFDQRFDAFWQRIRNDYGVMTVRDSSFLNWRYFDLPGEDYLVLAMEKTDSPEILGYIVLGEKHRELKVGQILDIVTPRTGHDRVAAALLVKALKHFRKRKLSVAICWMLPHCHPYKDLQRLMFRVREKEGMDLIIRHTDPDAPAAPHDFLVDEKNWYICIGDSDWY